MPLTASNNIAIGTRAPDFQLQDTTGRTRSLADVVEARALLVAFLSTQCPFVVHVREALAAYARDYAPSGVRVIAINSNDSAVHPAESASALGEEALRYGYVFPYLKDETQAVAKAYGAACTPDLYLFDGELKLFYHGQFDDSRPTNGLPVTGADLRAATDLVLAGKSSPSEQKQAIGCNIKWRAGEGTVWSHAGVAAE
ncbi:thioredoxin family protein [Ancylobacter terrae]|uniref:thioredoxin family protein n=1 Tax=Ancylobacter sp. sgz301288 TaxID=3342077 RepID=UPI00385EA1A8